MNAFARQLVRGWVGLGTRFLPFADAASAERIGRPTDDKRLMRARRAIEKTSGLLRGRAVDERFRHFHQRALVDPLAPLVAPPLGFDPVTLTAWQAASLRVGLVVSAGFCGVALALHWTGQLLVRTIAPLSAARSFPAPSTARPRCCSRCR